MNQGRCILSFPVTIIQNFHWSLSISDDSNCVCYAYSYILTLIYLTFQTSLKQKDKTKNTCFMGEYFKNQGLVSMYLTIRRSSYTTKDYGSSAAESCGTFHKVENREEKWNQNQKRIWEPKKHLIVWYHRSLSRKVSGVCGVWLSSDS